MTMTYEELLAENAALRAEISRAKAPRSQYTAEFEQAWSEYPYRPGMSKASTFTAWKARLKAGATEHEMIEGTRKYAAYVLAMGIEPSYVKQPATFFGPGEHFASDWTVMRSRPQQPVKFDPVAHVNRHRVCQ